MALREKLHTLLSNNRVDSRKEIVELFLDEIAGTGKGENTSKYHYIVENYNGYKIVLKRPAFLNKGFDFTVDIDGIKFKNLHNNGFHVPSHNDITNALRQAKENYPTKYNNIKRIILDLYEFNEPNYDLISDLKYKDYLNNEHPFRIILMAIKWLFIEQDITYWNWSGRNMLKSNLESLELL